DGIDGMACGPIFVSPSGADSNPGTRALPMRTVAAAVAAAALYTPRRDIYVATGMYTGVVATDGPVNIYGGYDPMTWVRSTSRPVIQAAGCPLFVDRAGSVGGTSLLSLMSISATTPVVSGQSAVGLIKQNAGGNLNLQSCVITT